MKSFAWHGRQIETNFGKVVTKWKLEIKWIRSNWKLL